MKTFPTFFTNVYALARSFIALSLLITLLFTASYVYFPIEFFSSGQASNTAIPNYFYWIGEEHLSVSIGVACAILLSVIIGYLPQITGILHAWIAYSFFTGALMVEGGDQIGQIIAFLLIPVSLFDKRINHWHKNDFFKYNRPDWLTFFCYSCLVVVQIQMAIVYFFAVAGKLNVPEWVDGSAFYYWFNHDPFGAAAPIRAVFSPVVNNPFLTPLITWGVLALEATLFAALFMNKDKKRVMFILGVAFHFMIIVIHGLWSFFFAMLGGLIIYLLPWDKRLKLRFWKN